LSHNTSVVAEHVGILGVAIQKAPSAILSLFSFTCQNMVKIGGKLIPAVKT